MIWIKRIKTRFGETFDKVIDVTIKTFDGQSVMCYVAEVHDNLGHNKLHRYVPMRDVVEIMDIDCNTYNLKE